MDLDPEWLFPSLGVLVMIPDVTPTFSSGSSPVTPVAPLDPRRTFTFSHPLHPANLPEASRESPRTMPRDPARSQPRWAQPREVPSHPNAPDASSELNSSHISYGYARRRPHNTRPRFRNVYPTD